VQKERTRSMFAVLLVFHCLGGLKHGPGYYEDAYQFNFDFSTG
jgi:hypothetical protein